MKSYTGYVHKRYGKAVVVFDGYCSASTKDMAHRRRAKGKLGPTVSFTKEMCLTVAKDIFLSNPMNKLRHVGKAMPSAAGVLVASCKPRSAECAGKVDTPAASAVMCRRNRAGNSGKRPARTGRVSAQLAQ